MNCNEARLAIGADPSALRPELAAHLRSCETCGAYRDEMTRLDGNIHRALGTDPPVIRRSSPRRTHAAAPTRRWALAASLALALVAGVAFWTLRPSDVLARELATHLDHEPASWSASVRIPPSTVRLALRDAGVLIDETAGDVVYARTCPFRGREIPHVVVKSQRGPVTVLLLPGERLAEARRFDEHGYSGMLLPSSGGAIAVLARGDTDVEEIARKIERAVRWNAVSSARTR